MSVTCKPVTPDLIQEALGFYKEHYLPNDPLLKAVGCTEMTHVDRHSTLSYLQEGLSWCAVDKTTGRMVGLQINRCVKIADLPDVAPTIDYVRRGWSRKLSSILCLFDSAFDTKQILTTYKVDKLMRLFALGVHCDYKKRGIATELIKRSMHHAAQDGVMLFAVLCTSAYTKRVCENQGFDKVKDTSYSTYVDETQSVLYKDIDVEEPHTAATCYVKRL